MRAVGYPRVSSDEQSEYGFGLDVQEQQIRALCVARGLRLAEVISDDFTGRTLERPGFSRVLQLAQDRAFDVLVVARIDRLARKNHLRRLAEVELEEYGIRVVYADQDYTDDPTGRFVKSMMGEVAELDSERIAKNTKDGRIQKAEKAKAMPVHAEPYGYWQVSTAQASAITEYAGRSGELIVVPEKAGFVKELFERAAAGQSLRSLAAWADTTEHRPKGGGVWTAGTIRILLRNPAYYGEAAYGRRKIIQLRKLTKSKKDLATREERQPESEWTRIPCPAIVTRALWDAVAERLTTNKSERSGRPSVAWPLSGGVAVCGVCAGKRGGALNACGHKNSTGRRYYECASRVRRDLPFCGARFPADTLEEAAKDALRQALSPGRLATLAREEAEKSNEAAGNPEQRERTLRAQLKACDEEIESIFERAKHGFDPSFIQKKVAVVNESRTDLEKQLAEVKAQAARLRDPEEAARQADAIAAKLSVGLEAALADPVRFKELARLLLSIRVFSDREPSIQVLPPSA